MLCLTVGSQSKPKVKPFLVRVHGGHNLGGAAASLGLYMCGPSAKLGTSKDVKLPKQVKGLEGVTMVQVECGTSHSVAVTGSNVARNRAFASLE